jgi:hypothetical protein
MLERLKRILFEDSKIVQLPGTKALRVGDKVTHPEHQGHLKIFSIPTGKHITGKIAFVYPSHIERPLPHELIKIDNPERLKVVNE